MEDPVTVIIHTPTGDIDASKTAVPESRRFRDAWRLEGEVIEVDMEAAREVARDQIRTARKPILEQLDVAYMRANEKAQTTKELVARKQALRDAPQDPRLDDAQDDNELASITDEIIEAM